MGADGVDGDEQGARDLLGGREGSRSPGTQSLCFRVFDPWVWAAPGNLCARPEKAGGGADPRGSRWCSPANQVFAAWKRKVAVQESANVRGVLAGTAAGSGVVVARPQCPVDRGVGGRRRCAADLSGGLQRSFDLGGRGASSRRAGVSVSAGSPPRARAACDVTRAIWASFPFGRTLSSSRRASSGSPRATRRCPASIRNQSATHDAGPSSVVASSTSSRAPARSPRMLWTRALATVHSVSATGSSNIGSERWATAEDEVAPWPTALCPLCGHPGPSADRVQAGRLTLSRAVWNSPATTDRPRSRWTESRASARACSEGGFLAAKVLGVVDVEQVHVVSSVGHRRST